MELSASDGRSLRLTATAGGVKEELVVPSRTHGGSYRVELVLPAGMTARQGGAGVELLDATGVVVASFGGGQAWDVKGASNPGAHVPVTSTLIGVDDSIASVVVSVDPAWFAAAERVFPVTIDPQLEKDAAADTFVRAGLGSQWSAISLAIGTTDGGATVSRTMMRFDVSSIVSTPTTVRTVTEADLFVRVVSAAQCSAPFTVSGLASAFDASTVWSNQPGADSVGVVSTTTLGSGCAGDTEDVDVTSLAQRWVRDAAPNHGLVIAAGNETDNNGAKTFEPLEAEGSHQPYLKVTYTDAPAAAVAVQPADGAVVDPSAPSNDLKVTAGLGVKTWFRVTTGPDAESGSILDSGWLTGTSWTPPANSLVDGQVYYWHTWAGIVDPETGDVAYTKPTWVRKFTVDRRLGTSSAWAMDNAGAGLTVNLANGNLVGAWASPAMPSLGGPIGVSYAYNSKAPALEGLTGSYILDADADRAFDAGEAAKLVRTDPRLAFDWNAGSPLPDGSGADNLLARWSGFVTVPTTGSYQFGAASSDGVRVTVNNTLVLDRWFDQTAGAAQYGSSISLTAGVRVPILVEYYEASGPASLKLYAKGAVTETVVPSSWLSPSSGALPSRWTLGAGPVGWVQATYTEGSVRLVDTAGRSVTFEALPGGGWKPPAGSGDLLARTADGQITLHSTDGTTYQFDAAGNLTSATLAADDKAPAAPTYTYSGTPIRLSAITDPVSARSVTLRYGGDSACPGSPPSGFDSAAPDGMLCEVAYWDGTTTKVWYVSGQLGRIDDPGGSITDFAYNAGLLASVRSALAADAIAAGVRADDATTRTEIVYTPEFTITGPAPTTGAVREGREYSISASSPKVDVEVGTSHFDWDFTLDPAGRVLIADDSGGLRTRYAWYAGELPSSVIDPAGRRTGYRYDWAGRVTDTWGPGPSSWFTSPEYTEALPAYQSQMPHSTSVYDGGITGLAATYWSNTDFTGPPAAHGTGVGGTGGALVANWGTGTPDPALSAGNWSGRYSGHIQLITGATQFRLDRAGQARLWIDDTLVIDGWTTGDGYTTTGTFTHTPATAGWHRLRVEYRPGSTARLGLEWDEPPASSFVTVPGAKLNAGYGLTTRTTVHDATAGSPSTVTDTTYAEPHTGMATTSIVDPTGLALTTATAYETIGTGNYLRRVSRTLPAGNAWTYDYYGTGTNPTSVANPCTGGPTIHQGGAQRYRTGPDPDGGGSETPRVEEAVYDAAGRAVATRVGSGSWECATYDNRGRLTARNIPAFGGEPARTVTHNHAVGGNPLITLISDAAGTITTTVDLLGRAILMTDVWGNTTTTTYGPLNRVASTSGPAGTQAWTYDNSGRPVTQSLDAKLIAAATYAGGELIYVEYEKDSNKAGNDTQLGLSPASPGVLRDSYGRVIELKWVQHGGTTIARDQVTRSQSGRVTDQSVDSVDPYPAGRNYTYDAAGRLTAAEIPGHSMTWAFAGTGGCGSLATAGKNTNRTSQVDNAVTTTYCYDQADKLTSTTATGFGTLTYDAHGNTTTLGAQTLGYDGSDRHLHTTEGSTTVRYVRDALDRIVSRSVNGVVQARYGYTAGTDSASFTQDTSGALLERTIGVIGGATVTKRAGGDVWNYPNIHGDVIATANTSGTKTGSTLHYDPYGNPLGAIPDNSTGTYDYGWLGQHQRGLEHEAGLDVIEMGARPYSPGLGRFLEIDPIEGGSCNDYDYVCGMGPNAVDLDGKRICVDVFCQFTAGFNWINKAYGNGLMSRWAYLTAIAKYYRQFYKQFPAALRPWIVTDRNKIARYLDAHKCGLTQIGATVGGTAMFLLTPLTPAGVGAFAFATGQFAGATFTAGTVALVARACT